jgi:lysozyme
MSIRRVILGGTTAAVIAVGSIMGWEGKHNKAYLDLVQVPTICYGTTRYPDGKPVRLGDIKNDSECTDLMYQEVLRIDAIITRTVKVKLKDHERAALISWIYNVGETKFYTSTLLRKLNAGDVVGACNELPRWVYADGKKLRGLVNRRADERLLCLGEKK